MAQSYTRQSSFADGDTITAALFNNEYNQLVNAFSYSSTNASTTGHRHDGSAGEGGNIPQIGDLDFLNKIVVDSTNNRWGFYVQVASSAVEQLRLQDGALIPVTDSDVDLGTSSLYFKDAYIDSVTTTGNVSIGGNLTVTGNATISGNLTFGDADTDSINLAAEIDSHIVPNTDDTYDLGTSTKQWRNLYIDGTAEIDTLAIDGTTVTSTAAELNILDGVTSTAAELNILDGVTSTTAELNILDGVTATAAEINLLDGVTSTTAELNILDGVTSTAAELNILDGVTATAAEINLLDGVTSTTAELNILDGVTSTAAELNILDGKAFLDEDNMASNSATGIASQQSIKAYVDSQVTAQDLDITTDSGTIAIDLDSETLTVTGGTGLDSSATGNAVTLAIDSTVTTLTGSQTLTNKTIDVDSNTVTNIEVDNLKSGVLDTDLTSVAATDTTLASAKAIKTYVDSQVTAQDLDLQGDTGGALSIDLDSESLTIAGGTGIDTSGATNTLTVAIDSTVATLTGTQTLTNKTLTTPIISSISNTGTLTLPTSTDTLVGRATTDTLTNKTLTSPVINTGVSGTAFLDDDTFATATSTTLASSESIKAYVDTTVAATNEVVEDTTPQLGGDLDLNSNDITGTGNINITGTIQSSGNITGTLATAAQPNITSLGTLTGLDVAGTPTFDGLTVDGSAGFGVTAPSISEGYQIHIDTVGNGVWGGFGNVYLTSNYKFNSSNKFAGTGYAQLLEVVPSTGTFTFKTSSASGTADATATMQNRLNIATTGDISFYDDTGTSQALFWDASAESLGIGTTSPSVALEISDSTANAILRLTRNDTIITVGNQIGALEFAGADADDAGVSAKIIAEAESGAGQTALAMYTGTPSALSERLRIDKDGNVGIGTTSPSSVLHLSTSNDPKITLTDTGFGASADITGSNGNLRLNSQTAIHFDMADSEVARFDSSGNLLVGKTSSTGVGTGNIEVSHASSATVQIEGGTHEWSMLVSSSADALRFYQDSTEKMRIDSSGNVGIGTTSPSSALDVTGKIKSASATQSALYLSNAAKTTGFLVGRSLSSNDAQDFFIYDVTAASTRLAINSSGNVGIGTSSPTRTFEVNSGTTNVVARFESTDSRAVAEFKDPSGSAELGNIGNEIYFAPAGTEKVRIDASGNVGIGTSSIFSGNKLDVRGGNIMVGGFNTGTEYGLILTPSNTSSYWNVANITGGHLTFNNSATIGSTERMRIDSSGNLLVGKTVSNVANIGQEIRGNGETFHTIASANNTLHVYSSTASAYRFYVSHAGQIHATSTSITAISDERLKENIVDLETGLSEVMSLQPRRFDWKNGDGENVAGFIAQEVETVLPDLISDYKHENLDDAKSVRMGDMIPTLVKAIQEQQAQIEALQSEINELKNS